MGNIFQDIFGGSNNQQSSTTQSQTGDNAYPAIQSDFGPSAAGFGGVTSGLSKLLGVGSSNPLQAYYNQGGGQFQLNQGLDALNDKYSAMGLRQSGAAMKGMERFRQGLSSTYLNQYLGQLGDLGKLDLGAGGILSDAGKFGTSSGSSTGNSNSSNGIASTIGALMAFI